jgi:hypothetical protein
MNGALSDALTVPHTSRNLEQMIEGVRSRGYCLVSALRVEEAVANLERMSDSTRLSMRQSLA